jgi:hypothetical protein
MAGFSSEFEDAHKFAAGIDETNLAAVLAPFRFFQKSPYRK